MGLLQGPAVDLAPPLGHADRQGVVAQPVQAPGDPLGQPKEQPPAIHLENGSKTRPHLPQAVVDEGDGLGRIQMRQEPVDIDPLAEVAHCRTVQILAEFVLPHQQDLEELLVRGFDGLTSSPSRPWKKSDSSAIHGLKDLLRHLRQHHNSFLTCSLLGQPPHKFSSQWRNRGTQSGMARRPYSQCSTAYLLTPMVLARALRERNPRAKRLAFSSSAVMAFSTLAS